MSHKKTMKEWGVHNELELLREIIVSSPSLRKRVEQRLGVLRDQMNDNSGRTDSGKKKKKK